MGQLIFKGRSVSPGYGHVRKKLFGKHLTERRMYSRRRQLAHQPNPGCMWHLMGAQGDPPVSSFLRLYPNQGRMTWRY